MPLRCNVIVRHSYRYKLRTCMTAVKREVESDLHSQFHQKSIHE